MTRTFIALELDEPLQRCLGEIIRRAGLQLPNLRWVNPVGIHLTLAFLGELTDEQLASAAQAAELAAQELPPFDYHLSHLGIFGSPRQPRVIWIGVAEPDGRLLQLHSALQQELEQRRFELDQRPFSPHLTLSRVKVPLQADEQQKLQHWLTGKNSIPPSLTSHARHLSVMKSELLPTGARYTCLQKCALGGK